MGLYVAEGAISSRDQIRFFLNVNEKEYVSRLRRIVHDWGHSSRVYPNGPNGIVVCAFSVVLHNAFPKWFGGESHDKKIPDFILNSKSEIIKSFLGGYEAGDGSVHIYKNRPMAKSSLVSITTVSPILAKQLPILGLKIGYEYRVYKCSAPKTFSIVNGHEVRTGKSFRIRRHFSGIM